MYIHTLTRFCESQRRFSLLIPLKYYILFFLSVCSLSAPLLRRVSIRASLLRLSSAPAVCSVPACLAVCPLSSSPFVPIWRALKLSGGLLCVLPCVFRLLPSLVRYQAQDAVAMWTDAPRICPRPCLPLSMCCRGLFRCPFRGFRPCVLLPCVVWW